MGPSLVTITILREVEPGNGARSRCRCPPRRDSAQEEIEGGHPTNPSGLVRIRFHSRRKQNMKRSAVISGVLAMAASMVLTACDSTPVQVSGEADHLAHATVHSRVATAPAHGAPDLARMRAGSAEYRNVEHALSDGFLDVSGCVAAPPIPDFPFSGAMGHHFVSFDRLADVGVDPSRPEILLYAPTRDGRMELVAVEFAVNREAWYAAGNAAPPSVAGVTFDPPNPMAESPIVQTSYTLHVWLWKDNPDGLFAPFNPNVSCG
jgi:hypothetical protein